MLFSICKCSLNAVSVLRPIITPSVVRANTGSSVTLHCDDRGRRNAKVVWRRLDGRAIPPHYLAYDGRDLQIKGADIQDASEYICSLVEHGRPPVDSNPATLVVTRGFQFL